MVFSILRVNQRVGWNLFLEKNKQACLFIREVRVSINGKFMNFITAQISQDLRFCSLKKSPP